MPKNKYPSLDRKKGLYLKHVPGKGRGVFCKSAIRAGEVLEVTAAVVLNERATAQVDKTLLGNYTFVTGNISKRQKEAAGVKNPDNASSAVMGILTFCNHGRVPNAEISWAEMGGTLYYILKATRKIPRDTEICTTYGEGWFADRDTQAK